MGLRVSTSATVLSERLPKVHPRGTMHSTRHARQTLSIVIPALNEEDSIAETIERTLAARGVIMASGAVTEVEVTVVSDGSTDATVERARRFGDRIRLIVFERNRGYGAAIMEAWSRSDADLHS